MPPRLSALFPKVSILIILLAFYAPGPLFKEIPYGRSYPGEDLFSNLRGGQVFNESFDCICFQSVFPSSIYDAIGKISFSFWTDAPTLWACHSLQGDCTPRMEKKCADFLIFRGMNLCMLHAGSPGVIHSCPTLNSRDEQCWQT